MSKLLPHIPAKTNWRLEQLNVIGESFTAPRTGFYDIQVETYCDTYGLYKHVVHLIINAGTKVDKAYLSYYISPLTDIQRIIVSCSYEYKPFMDTPLWKALNG